MERRELLTGMGGLVLLQVISVAGCKTGTDSVDEADADTDADTDADVDADTDSDTDADTDADVDTGGPPPSGGASAPDNEGHGHTLMVPESDILDATGGSYPTTGSHPHTIPVSPSEMATLRDTGAVTIQSNDSHPHTWDLVSS